MTQYFYTASIAHNEQTIQSLFRTQYYSYEKFYITARFLIGLAFIIMAVSLSLPVWGRGILLIAGTWLVSTPDFPSQVKADKVFQLRKNSLPEIRYKFYDDHVNLSDKKNADIPYKNFTRLIYDDKYFYMFIAKNSACMIDKFTINPENITEFMKFTELRTSLTWYRQKSLLEIDINYLRQMIREFRER